MVAIAEGLTKAVIFTGTPKPVLYVEDSVTNAKLMKRVFVKNFPHLELHIVSDAYSAKKALYGDEFYQWDPDKDEYQTKKLIRYHAVIWDNQFPAAQGDAVASDMGIQTAQEVALSTKVSAVVCSRFAAHSADSDQNKFKQAGVFSSVLPKPLNLQELKNTFTMWGLVPGEDVKEQA